MSTNESHDRIAATISIESPPPHVAIHFSRWLTSLEWQGTPTDAGLIQSVPSYERFTDSTKTH